MAGIATLQDVERLDAAFLDARLPSSTYELIQSGASRDPHAPALTFFLSADLHRESETWTYAELLTRITQTANFFHRLGATKNTIIAFVLPNLPETHFVIWGGEAAGVVVALNPLLEGPALAALLQAARAEIVVTLAPFPGVDLWEKLAPVLAEIRTLRHLVLVDLVDHLRALKGFDASAMQGERGAGAVRTALGSAVAVHDFSDSIARENGLLLESGRTFSKQDTSSYFCTGGTTGLPKLAIRCHRNEVANAWSAMQTFGTHLGPGKVIFCGLPLFHVNAVLVTGLLAFATGAHVILGTPQGYRGLNVVTRFWEIVEHYRVNFFSGVPTLYSSLLQVPIGQHDVSTLEYGVCGAAPLPVEVLRTFEQRTGLSILEGYGLTEATCISSANPPGGERRLGSIGLRLPGQRMKAVVLDEQANYVRDCAVDEVGTIAVNGPNVFVGYLQPEQNAQLWIDCADGTRWLNTGDLGRQDADGYFWLTGRKKELIIRGGHNIDPAMIEEPLHRHPAVEIAAAVGRPDAHAGELPVAYVQLRAGMTATESELSDFLKREISERAAVPKHVCIVENMPLSAVGKIFKPALKQRETKHALEAALQAANIAFRDLAVTDDPSKGFVVAVQLVDAAASAAARQVLGRFPFPFSVA